MPEWYSLLKAAKYLGVPPWDLLKQPTVWWDWARMAETAEYESRQQKRQMGKG